MVSSNKKKVRESGIEVLRIILMIQIIILHIYTYGKFDEVRLNRGGPIKAWGKVFWMFCRIPVPCFIMISGYFMINNNIDTIKKSYLRVWRLYKQIWCYSVLIMVGCLIACKGFGYPNIFDGGNKYGVIKAFFPLSSKCWYFITLYVFVCLFAPFINTMVAQLNKKQYNILLALCFVAFSLLPILAKMTPFSKVVSVDKVVNVFGGKSLGCFLCMYLVGGYLRKHGPKEEEINKYFCLLMFFLLVVLDYVLFRLSYSGFNYARAAVGENNNIIVVLECIAAFMFFRGIKFKSSVVNLFASVTLNVYMLHESTLIRRFIWDRLMDLSKKNHALIGQELIDNHSWVVVLLTFIVFSIAVYLVCFAIEMIRRGVVNLFVRIFKKKEINVAN